MAILSKTNITTTAVGNALGSGSRDVGTLCTHPNINKWSKHKPIRYPKASGLVSDYSKDEWEGTEGDKIQGIYYGLKGTTEAGNISNIHSVTFEYVGKPTGGVDSPYRLGDFRGYDANAKCNLYGVFSKTEVNIDKDSISISIYYDEYNTTGVDINKLVPQNTALNDIGHCYPCVVIDNYIHALKNVDTNDYTPMKYNGAWQRYFKIEVDQSTEEGRLPLYPQAYRKVSFCLVDKLYHYDGSYDFRKWLNVDNLVDNTNTIAIPDSTGLTVHFVHLLPPIVPTSAYGDLRGFTIKFSNHMEPNKEYKIPVRVRDIGSGNEYTYHVSQSRFEVSLAEVSLKGVWGDLNILPSRGQTYRLSVIVDYEGKVSSKTFSITIN